MKDLIVNMKIIYEDEEIKCYFSPGDSESKRIVFTFGDATMMVADSDLFFAQKILLDNRIPSVGIMPKRPHWYPYISIYNFIDSNINLFNSYSEKIGYGYSMGAYAAIKFSRKLGLNFLLAMAPQWSINPSEIHYPTGFQKFYKQEMGLMGIVEGEVSGNLFIFFDPYNKEDANHFEKIRCAHKNTFPIRVNFSGHGPGYALKGARNLLLLFKYASELNLNEMYLLVNILKRINPNRKHNLMDLALQRKLIFSSIIILNRGDSDEFFKGLLLKKYRYIIDGLYNKRNDLFLKIVSMRLKMDIDIEEKILNELMIGKGRLRYIQAHTKKFLFFDPRKRTIVQKFFDNSELNIPLMACVKDSFVELFFYYYESPIYIGVDEFYKFKISFYSELKTKFEYKFKSEEFFSISYDGKFLTASPDDSVTLGPSSPHSWEMFKFEDGDIAKLWR